MRFFLYTLVLDLFLHQYHHYFSMKPNIYVGLCEGSSMYRKWYFEVVIDHFEAATHLPPVLRIGWANSKGFLPYPGGGEGWGCNGAGDDLYSFAFDGINLWTGMVSLCDVIIFRGKNLKS